MGKIYTHPTQFQMQVEVILASRGANGAPPIYTLRMRYPRIIHAEVETHRIMSIHGTVVEVYEPGLGIMSDSNLSRNARSSRAVPVKTMLDEVRTIPFIPWHWGKNQKGMQAGEPFDAATEQMLKDQWLYDAKRSANSAEWLMEQGVHKQIPNRLLEPFSWIDTLVTATEWANFLWLRDHEEAEPHLQDLARLVRQAIDEADVQVLGEGGWHMPYITENDRDAACFDMGLGTGNEASNAVLLKLSAARCARISYVPFDGDASYEAELRRYDLLMGSDRLHASPVEHQAQVDKWVDPNLGFDFETLRGNFAPGWVQNRQTIPGQFIPS